MDEYRHVHMQNARGEPAMDGWRDMQEDAQGMPAVVALIFVLAVMLFLMAFVWRPERVPGPKASYHLEQTAHYTPLTSK